MSGVYSRVRAAAADDNADVVVNVELVADALGVATPECEAVQVLLKVQQIGHVGKLIVLRMRTVFKGTRGRCAMNDFFT